MVAMIEDSVLTLNDGRRLAYARYGVQSGIPIMLFHGLPGSRIAIFSDSQFLNRNNIHLIMADRPGYGGSDPDPDRSLLSWADDTAQLADHLEINQFHILGGSGGGPYCLACAYALPKRVLSTSIFSCVSPLNIPGVFKGMAPRNRFAFMSAHWFPFLLRPIASYVEWEFRRNPETVLQAITSQPSKWDSEIMRNLQEQGLSNKVIEHFTEAYRQGIKGKLSDGKLVTREWGFPFNDIKTKVFLWHGTADTLTPLKMGRYLANAIPGCEATFVKDGGHLLLNNPELAENMIQKIIKTQEKQTESGKMH